MASRYNSHLTQREGRSTLFSAYDARPSSQSPHNNNNTGARPNSGYSSRYGSEPHSTGASSTASSGAFSAYPSGGLSPPSTGKQQFRAATPNSRGQYSDAVLSELESQNDDEVSGIFGKVGKLKEMTMAIGDEIRESSALADKMNDSFDSTRARLGGTMKRMLRMADKTGVGWRVWLGFFAAVILLFWYVWLF